MLEFFLENQRFRAYVRIDATMLMMLLQILVMVADYLRILHIA